MSDDCVMEMSSTFWKCLFSTSRMARAKPHKKKSFETVFFDNMGNAVPMVSEGSRFSARQKDTFRKLQRNRRFYISRVTAIGPDGIQRKLTTSMEVIVK